MRVRNPLLIRIIAWFGCGLMRLLFMTCRIDVHERFPATDPAREHPAGRRFCYCIWHEAAVVMVLSRRIRNMAALISRHPSASLLACAAQAVGIRPIRGSTSKGGAAATRCLIDQAGDRHITVTPDGPRGPMRVMKPGIVYIASRAGHPIICVGMAASRSWTMSSRLTEMTIPKPFSRIVMLASLPIHIPSGLSMDEIERQGEWIQEEMDRINAEAERIVRGDDDASDVPMRQAA